MLDSDVTLQKIKEAQAGSEDAKVLLIENNLPLIKSIVRRYKNKQIDYDDLIQLGTLGLVKAINHFNCEYGVRFSTYAVPMIAGEIKRFIRDDGAIKVSRSIKSEAQKLNQFIEEYRHREEREPDIETLCKQFNMSPADIIFLMDSARYPVSIYAETEEEGLSLADKIVAKGTPEDTIDKMLLRDLIAELPPREKKIILLRYFRDMTQNEIAREMGVSQVQISRIESKILRYLKKQLS
jgi:RNA polymerase sporulation-specific sigma factor